MALGTLPACSGAAEVEPAVAAPMPVGLAAAARGTVEDVRFASGTVHAARRAVLQFETPGKVVFLKSGPDGMPLREGDRVKRGDVLARLDARLSRAALRQARAGIDGARALAQRAADALARTRRLRGTGAVPPSALAEAEAAHAQAAAQLAGAEAGVAQAAAGARQGVLRAPFDGVVAFVNIREGDLVQPALGPPGSTATTAPITLVDPAAFELVVALPAWDGAAIRPGQAARLQTAASEAERELRGAAADTGRVVSDTPAVVSAVSPAVDPAARAVRVRLRTTGADPVLRDGAYVHARIVVDVRENVVTVPHEALVYRGDDVLVYVFEAGTVRAQTVQLGLVGTRRAEVIRGLAAGAQVVTHGRFKVTSGMPVRRAKAGGA